ncbi:hypothetical protein FRX31_017164 [Thalictrum thalictroides]|uniref:Uncharacterized protein n=1 Tax=Thalictrum thalictroides TaxID=46969 RepID=A0A7J6W7N0_THATH|nr:hypothetical protein FRX31_017164 [Thalictrum thalictroides]
MPRDLTLSHRDSCYDFGALHTSQSYVAEYLDDIEKEILLEDDEQGISTDDSESENDEEIQTPREVGDNKNNPTKKNTEDDTLQLQRDAKDNNKATNNEPTKPTREGSLAPVARKQAESINGNTEQIGASTNNENNDSK